MTRGPLVGALLCMLALPCTSRAQPGWFDVRLPGSINGLLSAAGLDEEPGEGARLTPYLLRRLQDIDEATRQETPVNVPNGGGADAWARPGSAGIRNYLEAFRILRIRWRVVEQRAGVVSLGAANDRRGREALEEFLEVLGLGLVRNRGDSVYRVVVGDGRGEPRPPYVQWLNRIFSGAGWRPESIQSRLNAGEAIVWDPEQFMISLPAPPDLWRSFLNGSGDAADADSAALAGDEALEVLARVIADPIWKRLHDALAALDVSVMENLQEHSEVFRQPSLRLANFLETIARLPRGHQLFVFGAWQDGAERRRGLDALWRLVEGTPTDTEQLPRHLDPAEVLRAVMVGNDGAPRGPASRVFWSMAFRDRAIAQQDLDVASSEWEDGAVIDAAFLLGAIMSVPAHIGRSRLHVLCFAQRVFHEAGREDAPEVLAVARAFGRYSMLMLSIERMGIRDAGVYVTLLRSASRFSGTRNLSGWHDALSRFQGAIALVERARVARALSPAATGDALVALAELPPESGVTEWLAEHLLPVLNLPLQPDFESRATESALLAVLAGEGPGVTASLESSTDWEGLEYRFDRGAMQLERFERTRGELRGPSLDAALTVWMHMRRLERPVAAEDVAAVAETLLGVAAGLVTSDTGGAGVSARNVAYARRLQSETAALHEVAEELNPGRLRDIVQDLGSIAEALAADALRTLLYTVHLAPAEGLIDGDLAARHDFGADPGTDTALRRTPWTAPRGIATAQGWSVQGSLLSLDLAFAHLYLPRVSRVLPSGGLRFLEEEDVLYLTHAVALFNPAAVSDTQVAGIAGAIRRGRERVERLAEDVTRISDLAQEIRLDPVRQDVLERAASAGVEGLDRLLARVELFWLGLRDADSLELPNWGAPTTGLDGCLCLRVPFPEDLDLHGSTRGRLAFRFADLQFSLAEEVDRLALPASVVRDLLPMATRELLDGARITHAGDIDALLQYVDELDASRIEDYVASLVHSGPFFPPISSATPGFRR